MNVNGVTLIEDLDYINGGYMKSGQLEPRPRPQSYYAEPEPEFPAQKICTIDDIGLYEVMQFIEDNPVVKKAFQIDLKPYIIIIVLLTIACVILSKKAFFDSAPVASFPDLMA